MRPLSWILTAIVLGSCSDQSAPLVARDIEITAPRPGANMSAGYLTLANTTDAAIRIDGVTSPQFGRVEIHESIVEGDVARMRRLSHITVGANESVILARGGRHLMLMQPEEDPETVTLVFYTGDAPVLSVAAAIRK